MLPLDITLKANAPGRDKAEGALDLLVRTTDFDNENIRSDRAPRKPLV